MHGASPVSALVPLRPALGAPAPSPFPPVPPPVRFLPARVPVRVPPPGIWCSYLVARDRVQCAHGHTPHAAPSFVALCSLSAPCGAVVGRHVAQACPRDRYSDSVVTDRYGAQLYMVNCAKPGCVLRFLNKPWCLFLQVLVNTTTEARPKCSTIVNDIHAEDEIAGERAAQHPCRVYVTPPGSKGGAPSEFRGDYSLCHAGVAKEPRHNGETIREEVSSSAKLTRSHPKFDSFAHMVIVKNVR